MKLMEKFDVYRLDGHALRIFLKVFETNSVTKTAAYFSLNQSTISHTLEKIRLSVGQNLFEKAGRGIIPTQAAHELAPVAKQVLAHLESMPLLNAFNPKTDARDISIAANVTELLPKIKAIQTRLKSELPDRYIRFLELGSRDNLEPLLDSGQADVALSISVLPLSPLLESKSVIFDDVRVFYDPGQRGPVHSIDDYFNAEHAVLDFGGTSKSIVAKKLEDTGRTRKVVLGAPNVYALATLLRGTKLVATLQHSLSAASFKGLASTPAPFPANQVVFDLIWHRRHANAPRNIWLRDLIISELERTQLPL